MKNQSMGTVRPSINMSPNRDNLNNITFIGTVREKEQYLLHEVARCRGNVLLLPGDTKHDLALQYLHSHDFDVYNINMHGDESWCYNPLSRLVDEDGKVNKTILDDIVELSTSRLSLQNTLTDEQEELEKKLLSFVLCYVGEFLPIEYRNLSTVYYYLARLTDTSGQELRAVFDVVQKHGKDTDSLNLLQDIIRFPNSKCADAASPLATFFKPFYDEYVDITNSSYSVSARNLSGEIRLFNHRDTTYETPFGEYRYPVSNGEEIDVKTIGTDRPFAICITSNKLNAQTAFLVEVLGAQLLYFRAWKEQDLNVFCDDFWSRDLYQFVLMEDDVYFQYLTNDIDYVFFEDNESLVFASDSRVKEYLAKHSEHAGSFSVDNKKIRVSKNKNKTVKDRWVCSENIGPDIADINANSNITFFYDKPEDITDMIVGNIMKMHSSYIIPDADGTYILRYGDTLQENGYIVKRLSTEDPQFSNCYNPFDYLYDSNGNIDDAKINSSLKAIMYNFSSSPHNIIVDTFWKKTTEALLRATILYILEFLPKEKRNLSTLLWLLRKGQVQENDARETELDKMFNEAKRMCSKAKCLSSYEIFKLAPTRTATAVLTSAAVVLDLFNRDDIHNMTTTAYKVVSRNLKQHIRKYEKDPTRTYKLACGTVLEEPIRTDENINIAQIGERKTAVFLQCNNPILLSLFYTQLFYELIDIAQKGTTDGKHTLEQHLQIIMSDMSAHIPELPYHIATCRKYNIGYTLCLNTLGELVRSVGSSAEAELVLNCCTTTVLLGTRDAQTAQYIGRRCSGAKSDINNADILNIMTADENKALVLQAGKDTVFDKKYRPDESVLKTFLDGTNVTLPNTTNKMLASSCDLRYTLHSGKWESHVQESPSINVPENDFIFTPRVEKRSISVASMANRIQQTVQKAGNKNVQPGQTSTNIEKNSMEKYRESYQRGLYDGERKAIEKIYNYAKLNDINSIVKFCEDAVFRMTEIE